MRRGDKQVQKLRTSCGSEIYPSIIVAPLSGPNVSESHMHNLSLKTAIEVICLYHKWHQMIILTPSTSYSLVRFLVFLFT